jgi:hypothetical protein
MRVTYSEKTYRLVSHNKGNGGGNDGSYIWVG